LNHIIRPSRLDDLDALYQMAKITGGGFTNLPPDRELLEARLARSAAGFAKETDEPGDDLYLFFLEELSSGRLLGTVQIFSMVGQTVPFYSYRINLLTQHSRELKRSFHSEILTLTTDYKGCSEVGGLFLHPRERTAGLGELLARHRYLFMAMHRARFTERTVAELRGVIDESGDSAFWNSLGGRFFGMTFREADEFNALNGHQFIADLMPQHPIYTTLLPSSARNVIGQPHLQGRAAMRMLEKEGFTYEKYVDIFDAGPTMEIRTDDIRTLREAAQCRVVATDLTEGPQVLAATGALQDYRCCYAMVAPHSDGVAIDPAAATALKLAVGDIICFSPR
jgi:arginine N-succinyltransferase